MADIQTAATQAAPTGTGITYTPWDLRGPKGAYRAEVSGQKRRDLTLTRIDAVPTKGYEGALRTTLKNLQQATHAVTGVNWPKVFTIQVSVPDFLTPAEKLAWYDENILAARNDVIRQFAATGVVPQS